MNYGDETQWCRLDRDDELLSPPAEVARPLLDPKPGPLNTHEMPSWNSFEKLFVAMAREIDGAYDVRLFGSSGQRQHGIDLVGFFDDADTTVYQAKQWRSFGARDLRAAVVKYADGERPFGAGRLIVAVASEVTNTVSVKELARLRARYPDLQIELWDRVEISRLLERHPRVVARFFGIQTAQRFCDVLPTTGAGGENEPIAADAVLRGPIAHLGERERYEQARDRLAAAPVEAAALFDQVAARLELSPFAEYGTLVRQQQAAALDAAQEYEAAARLRIDLGWRSYRAADPWAALWQVSKLAQDEENLSPSVVRAANGLSAAAAFGYERSATLNDLAAAFDAMEPADQGRTECALVLAEQALSWHRTDFLVSRAIVLTDLADSTPVDDRSLAVRARLLMCLSEASGDWGELTRTARTMYSPIVCAWVLARHARFLTMTGRPEQAVERWLDATERSTQECAYDAAADWLYGQRKTRMQYRMLNGDPDDLHRLAQALRSVGSGSVLPAPYPLAELAVLRLLDQKWPDALEYLYRYLSHAVITASWADEMTAHERLGDLFSATEKWPEAVTHYVRAGCSKKLERLVKVLPDCPFQFRPPATQAPVWERVSSFWFAAASAELLPDDAATEWARVALEELTSTPMKRSVTDTWLPAFKVFARVAEAATLEAARGFLDLTTPYLDRQRGAQWRTDEHHIDAITKIADMHPELRDRIQSILCQAILLDGEIGKRATIKGKAILGGNPTYVFEQLSTEAAEGHLQAAIGLIIAGANTTTVLDVARDRYERAIRPTNDPPDNSTLGTDLPETALFVTALQDADQHRFVDAMLGRARDSRDSPPNRQDALAAISIVGSYLDEDTKDHVFQALRTMAVSPMENSNSFSFGTDPFSRFRVTKKNVSM